MPITKRQFNLGIDEDVQKWMRQIYGLLERDRELAFSSDELRNKLLGDSYQPDERANLERALDVLVQIGAVDKRWVTDRDYYAFRMEFDTDSWELSLDDI